MPNIDELGRKVKAKYPGQYDDLDDAEVGVRVKSKFPGAYDDFTDSRSNRQGFAGGLWQTTGAPIVQLAGEVGSALTAPRDNFWSMVNPAEPWIKVGSKVAKGMLDASGEQIGKAREAFGRGNYVQGAGRVLAAAIPGVGPAAAQAADTMIGSDPRVDERGNVIEPGVEGNMAAGLGQAAGLLVPFGVKPAMSGARAGLVRAGVPQALEASAARSYSRALNATTKGNKARSARVVPRLIERNFTALTTKGLKEKSAANVQRVGQAIGEAIDELPADANLNLEAIKGRLAESAREAFTVETPVVGERMAMSETADAGVRHASDLSKRLETVSVVDPATGERVLPVGTARRLRQYYDSIAQQAGRYDAKQLAEHSTAEAHGMAADAIREVFDETFPDISKINKEYSFWKDVDKVIGDTLLRRQGQAKPLGRKMAVAAGTGAGFASGGFHGALMGRAAMEGLESAMTSPGWYTVSAIVKDRLAKAIVGGDRAAAAFYVQKAKNEAEKGAIIPADAAQAPEAIAPGVEGRSPESGPLPATSGSSRGGAQTSVLIPGENRELPAAYEVRELSDLRASHSGVTFQPNPRYALKNDRDYTNLDNQRKVLEGSQIFNPRFHITDNPDAVNGPPIIDAAGNVAGGNGRTMTMDRVYKYNQKGAQAYREMLTARAAQFGLDPQQIAGMKQPVLVRRVTDPNFSGQDFITDLNKTGTAALRASERAIADSRKVSTGTLDDVAGRLDAIGADATLAQAMEGRGGAEILNRLIDDGVISPQERAAYASGDALTPDGKARIGRMLLGRFFHDPAQLDRVPAAVRTKLERMAAPLAKLEQYPEWDLTPSMKSALEIIEQTKVRNMGTIERFIKQGGILSTQTYSPKAIELANRLMKSKTSELLEAAKRYSQDAAFAAGGDGLFGEAPKPAESFKESFK